MTGIRPAPSPTSAMLTRLCAAVAPGSVVRRVRRLPGGLDGIMHAVELLTPSGERLGLVVRRLPRDVLARRPDSLARTWRTLVALAGLDVLAPRPVVFDAEGHIFDTPALVMARIHGRGLLNPRHPDSWSRQLGEALAAIHRAPIETVDLSFLPAPGPERQRREALSDTRRAEIEAHPLGPAILSAIARWASRLTRGPLVLSHGDYWAGNTVWLRNRLSGVVDWDGARLDDAGADVGYCRMDLAMLMAGDAPAVFLQGYERAAGRPISELFFWDLLGALPALPDPVKWLPGYHDLGRADITPATMRARLDRFVASALDRAG